MKSRIYEGTIRFWDTVSHYKCPSNIRRSERKGKHFYVNERTGIIDDGSVLCFTLPASIIPVGSLTSKFFSFSIASYYIGRAPVVGKKRIPTKVGRHASQFGTSLTLRVRFKTYETIKLATAILACVRHAEQW
jgi:hypothetical protein